MNEYEALFIIDPAKEGSFKEITENIASVVAKNNGKIEKDESWGKQRLAYLVKKNKDGIYYKLDFSIDPLLITKLTSAYKLDSNILRVMITKK